MNPVLKAVLAMAAAIAVIFGVIVHQATAADSAGLGGNCCADLEERIAELEASVARKGNKKVTVVVTGQISKGIIWYDLDDEITDYAVSENSNAPSHVTITGLARIVGDWKAGYTAQIGLGGYDTDILPGPGYGPINGDTNGLYVRKSFLHIEHDNVGKLSIGKLSMSSDEIMEITTVNTAVASTPLTLRPLTGPGFAEALELFDGGRTNAVRYDSMKLGGKQGHVVVSASFAASEFDSDLDPTEDYGSIWDVAVRYAGEFAGFNVAAGTAYRDGVVIPQDNLFGIIPIGGNIGDVKVYSGSASVSHIATGLFLTGAYGNLDYSDFAPGADDITGWSLQGGVEERWNALGKTTLFIERGTWDFGDDTDATYWGAGIVQALDPAATDLYLSGRRYDFEDLLGIEATTVMGGARIRF